MPQRSRAYVRHASGMECETRAAKVLQNLLDKIGAQVSIRAGVYAKASKRRRIRSYDIRIAWIDLASGSPLSYKVLPDTEARTLNNRDYEADAIRRDATTTKRLAKLHLKRPEPTPELTTIA